MIGPPPLRSRSETLPHEMTKRSIQNKEVSLLMPLFSSPESHSPLDFNLGIYPRDGGLGCAAAPFPGSWEKYHDHFAAGLLFLSQ